MTLFYKAFHSVIFLFFAIFFFSTPFSINTQAGQRFPNPEFKGGYQLPEPIYPGPLLFSEPNIALAVVVALLILTGYLLYIRRSRAGIRLLVVTSVIFFGFYHKGCICSVGSIQNITEALSHFEVVLPISVILVFLLPLFTALFWGRIFCSSACPLGALQDLVIYRTKKVPSAINKPLKVLPFIYLGVVVLFASCDLGYIICQYDPFVGFFRLSATPQMLAVGGALLLVGAFFARPYCRYICPYSILLKTLSRLSLRKVRISWDHCRECQICTRGCPVDAIRAPSANASEMKTQDSYSERRKWLLTLAPFIIAIGIAMGYLLAGPLTRIHPDYTLLEKVRSGSQEDDRVIAFFTNGGTIGELEKTAHLAKSRIDIMAALFGAYIALIFIWNLLETLPRRTVAGYEVDGSECVGCGRCYEYCPYSTAKTKQENKT